MKKAFLGIVLAGLFFPLISFGAYNTYQGNGKTAIYEGLVPCGKEICVFPYTDPKLVSEFLKYLKLFEINHPEFTFEKNCKELGKGLTRKTEWKPIPCQLCHFFVMFKGIINFVLFKIIFPIATLLLAVGGGMFLLHAEDPKKVETAKSLLKSVVIGLVIIFAAWLVVNTFFMIIGVADWTGLKEGWWQINCPIKL